MGKVGRPPKEASKKRTAFVKVYVTEAEKRVLSEFADDHGGSVSEFVRHALRSEGYLAPFVRRRGG